MTTDLEEARLIARQRLQRSKDLLSLHIVRVNNTGYILVSELNYIQLSNEYDSYERVDTVYKNE